MTRGLPTGRCRSTASCTRTPFGRLLLNTNETKLKFCLVTIQNILKKKKKDVSISKYSVQHTSFLDRCSLSLSHSKYDSRATASSMASYVASQSVALSLSCNMSLNGVEEFHQNAFNLEVTILKDV